MNFQLIFVLFIPAIVSFSEDEQDEQSTVAFDVTEGGKKLTSDSPFFTVYTWTALDFQFPNKSVRNDATKNGEFIQQNCIPIDTDVDYKSE